jgi:hypothetical protein
MWRRHKTEEGEEEGEEGQALLLLGGSEAISRPTTNNN